MIEHCAKSKFLRLDRGAKTLRKLATSAPAQYEGIENVLGLRRKGSPVPAVELIISSSHGIWT